MSNAFSRIGLQSVVIGVAALFMQPVNADDSFEAEVRVTSYGIPHVKADNYAGLGYGYGNFYASHNLCILAREVI